MRSFLSLFFLSSFIFANPLIEATRVLGDVSSVSVDSKAWLSAERVHVPFYLDISSSFAADSAHKRVEVEIDALHDGQHLALRFTWHDATQEVANSIIGVQGDGFGVALPQETGQPLPHPRVGARARPLYLEQLGLAKVHGFPQAFLFDRELLGFHMISPPLKTEHKRTSEIDKGPLAQESVAETSTFLELKRTEETWQGVMIQPIAKENTTGFLPVSAWIQEGARENAGVYLSGWMGVKLLGEKSAKEQESDFQATPQGDVTQGKALAIQHCSRCHWMGDIQFAPAFTAPRLDTIGAIGTVTYLKESLQSPHDVVLAGPTEHAWYRVDGVGLPNSNMPYFEWLEEEQMEDILTYLDSLKEAF